MSDAGLRTKRRGMTLVELLVVVAILAVLLGIAIPAMRPSLKGRPTREAARAVNVYFGSARIRAKEIGRSCGVVIERLKGQPECSMTLRQAEVPPPDAGDWMDSAVRVQDWSAGRADGRVWLVVRLRANDFSNGLIRDGDLMQLNHQGPWYTIRNTNFTVDSHGYIDFTSGSVSDDWLDAPLALELADVPGQVTPWPTKPEGWSQPVPFEILRQPMATNAEPLELPSGTVIDLTVSGTDPTEPPNLNTAEIPQLGWEHAAEDDHDHDHVGLSPAMEPVLIMFSPNGSVERVIYHEHDEDATDHFDHRDVIVVDPIYLLVGRRENVPYDATDPDAVPNYQAATSLWITLSPQSGLVSTTGVQPEMATVYDSREPAREALTKGGR